MSIREVIAQKRRELKQLLHVQHEALRPNGGMTPTCENCGHEPCADWCGNDPLNNPEQP
jgi:hypothetical protein